MRAFLDHVVDRTPGRGPWFGAESESQDNLRLIGAAHQLANPRPQVRLVGFRLGVACDEAVAFFVGEITGNPVGQHQ